jgi:hypothetical protein
MTIVLSSKYTLGEQGFDSMFYCSFVTNTVNVSKFGGIQYYSNQPLGFIYIRYDYSSFYYMQSWLLRITSFLFPTFNKVLFAPVYVWQASITLWFMVPLTIVNVIYVIKQKMDLWLLATIFSVFLVFYGGQYYNTALAFIGNSHRTFIVANLMTLIYCAMKNPNADRNSSIIFGFVSAALIAVSSSGFFINAFLLYSLFCYRLHKRSLAHLRSLIWMSLPTILFLVAYINTNISIVLTIVIALCLYGLTHIRLLQIIEERITFFLQLFLQYVVPCFIIAYCLLVPLKYTYLDFFQPGSRYDMVWDYFKVGSNLSFIINIFLISLFIWSLIPKKNLPPFNRILSVIFFTFLNPLVIPFTMTYLTDFVFYRAFDLFFNPFVLTFSLSTIVIPNRMKKIVPIGALLLSFPFMTYGILEFNKYYHWKFVPYDGYNKLIKMSDEQYEVLTKLNEFRIAGSIQKPRIVSQIGQAIGFVPNIELPIQYTNIMTNSFNPQYPECANELTNIFALRDYPDENWIENQEPKYYNTQQYLQECDINYVIINKSSVFYNSKDGIYIYLDSILYEQNEILYQSENYQLYRVLK